MRIPYIHVQTRQARCYAAAGFALSAIEAERAYPERGRLPDPSERLRQAHRNNVRFLELLSEWQGPFSFELHCHSRPSLDTAEPGRIRIGVELHVAAPDRTGAVERALSNSLLLEAMLGAFWSHADFSPIQAAEEFQQYFAPFQPGCCVQIHRRVRELSLACPFLESSRPLGFRNTEKAPAEPPDTVRHVFPWVPVLDDWSLLLETLLQYPAPQWIVVRVGNAAEPAPTIRELESILYRCEHSLASARGDQVTLTGQIQAIREVTLLQMARLGESALRTAVLLFAPGQVDEVVAAVLGQSISGDLTRGQSGSLYQGGFTITACDCGRASDALGFFDVEPYSSEEAACALRLPLAFSDEYCGLPVRKSRTQEALLPNHGGGAGPVTLLGVNRHRNLERPIQVDLEQRLKHIFLLGMTGTGKSTMMLSLLLQDLRQGHGVCLIDPHGELADDLLARFPGDRQDDLVVIDMADRRRPVPLNLLAWRTLDERDLIIDELLSALLRIYRDPAMFGPVFESHFRGMLKLLMGDRPNRDDPYTMLEFPRLYQSQAFRRHLVEQTEDEQVRDFVHEAERVLYGDGKPENIAPYITSKLSRFLQDSLLRRIVGHGKMTLDFHSLMDDRKVLVLKLARGQFGTNVADLITSQIVGRFRMAAMSRAEIPKSERRPFFLYVDELGSLARDETFSHLLSEARKYHLGLVLATQYGAQLRDSELSRNVLSAILGNVGTLISYRLGVEDAPVLAPVFAPSISAQDLIECPNYQGYMRLHLSRVATQPFSFRNQPDCSPASELRLEALSAASAERWGVPARECDERAHRRAQFIRQLEA